MIASAGRGRAWAGARKLGVASILSRDGVSGAVVERRTCLVVSSCNSLFSITGGFAIFSILGNLAHTTGRTVADVATVSGPGLAFISIAQGVQVAAFGREMDVEV